MSQTTRQAFEAYVETMLLGRGGWKAGTNAERDQQTPPPPLVRRERFC